ncbi:protein SAWADEE HOMEODOMAIN HOMOLOG 2 isoform X2 [Henckelia pumila]|uniref:protein SAWADEE HOMEODOMAIN HOMOLOG 2 isoform X2 n=1 Tax=Henckelia pumila TaxID=405737 RepID=UPI003C6E4C0B
MGRPPSNGGPSFRFNQSEVLEMDSILQAHGYTVPSREILEAIAQRFSNTAERSGKVEVSAKQVWNWFQNRRYALRAKATKAPAPEQVYVPPVPRDDQAVARNLPPTPQPQPVNSTTVKSMPQVTQSVPAPSAQNAIRNASDNSQLEFEAKSARDGAWYDVASFLSHRSLETADPEVLVRFAGFGPEEDEWVNIRRHVRQRSLPCESSECVAVLPGDLTLCFQEGKEQALYFDAHVLDAQRRRHDVRGCRCRFLVRYDHDQAEEIVPLRKVCRRPETDYRLQQLHTSSTNVNPQKIGLDLHVVNSTKISVPDETQKQPKTEEHVDGGRTVASPVTPPHAPATVESTLVPSNTIETKTETAVANSNPLDAATVPSGSNLSVQQG